MTKLINKLSGLVGIHRLCLTIYNVCAMSSASGESGDEVICRRLLKVPGDGEKWNDVIHCTDRDPRSVKQHVIFFGGDVQVGIVVCFVCFLLFFSLKKKRKRYRLTRKSGRNIVQ